MARLYISESSDLRIEWYTIRERKLKKHGEIIKAEFNISALRKHTTPGGLQGHNEREPGQRHSNKNICFRPNERQHSFLETQKDDRTYGERGGLIALEADTGGAKASGKRRSQDGGSTIQLGAISPRKAKKCKSRRWKEAYGEPKEMGDEENIISKR